MYILGGYLIVHYLIAKSDTIYFTVARNYVSLASVLQRYEYICMLSRKSDYFPNS